MSETTYPYEAVLLFAQSKGPEFDSFMRKWHEEHPKTEATILPAIVEAPVIEEPKKRGRKIAATASTPTSTTDTSPES